MAMNKKEKAELDESIRQHFSPLREAIQRNDAVIEVRVPVRVLLARDFDMNSYNQFVIQLYARMKEFGYSCESCDDNWDRYHVLRFELEGTQGENDVKLPG